MFLGSTWPFKFNLSNTIYFLKHTSISLHCQNIMGCLKSCSEITYSNQRLPGACNRSPGSKLLSITTQLHCGGHLGGRTRLPDTILEEDHPMTIPSKFGSNWATGSRQDGFMWISHRVLFKLSSAVQPYWSEGGTTRHNFGIGPSSDYFIKVWFQLSNWFQTRFLCEFPIGSYVKLSSAVGAILVEGPNRLTYFWKRTIQWLFHQQLVLIEQMVSNKKIFMGISHRVLC